MTLGDNQRRFFLKPGKITGLVLEKETVSFASEDRRKRISSNVNKILLTLKLITITLFLPHFTGNTRGVKKRKNSVFPKFWETSWLRLMEEKYCKRFTREMIYFTLRVSIIWDDVTRLITKGFSIGVGSGTLDINNGIYRFFLKRLHWLNSTTLPL